MELIDVLDRYVYETDRLEDDTLTIGLASGLSSATKAYVRVFQHPNGVVCVRPSLQIEEDIQFATHILSLLHGKGIPAVKHSTCGA